MFRHAAVLLAFAGCYDPRAQAGAPCSDRMTCPSGQRCTEGLCERDPNAPAFDASPIDAQAIPDGITRPDPGWYTVAPIPAPRSLACAVAGNGRLYAIGGSLTGTSHADVYVTDIADNGMLGAWAATTPLPTPTRWHACAYDEVDGAIFVVGGDLGATASRVVWRAPVTTGGVGAWTMQQELPSGRRGLGVVISGRTLFAIGGEERDGFTLRNTVFATVIQSDGTLDNWRPVERLPMNDYMFGTALHGADVYVTGGYNGHREVYRSTTTAADNSSWSALTQLPGPRERHASVALGDYLYVMGGEPTYATANLQTAFRAPIAADGALGAWAALPDLFQPVAYTTAATDPRGYIYVVAGSNNDGQIADVQLLVPPP